MFDWLAARPGRTGQRLPDQPTIPLTPDEHQAFDALCRQLPAGTGFGSQLARVRRSAAATTAIGVLLVVGGGAWIIAWLSLSVAAAFVGVLVQALGFAAVAEAQGIRLRPDESAAPPEASPLQHDARRRRGQ